MKKLRFIVIIILLSVCVTMLTQGCSKKTDTEKSDEQIKIAGMIYQEDQFFRLVQFGMSDAAEKANVKFLLGNSISRPDKEIELVNTYIARKVDGIVISPLSKVASVTALKRAHDKGIKIITYNSTVGQDIPTSYIESDQFDLGVQTGKAARKYIEEKLGGKAKVAILAFKSVMPEQSNDRSNGFKQEILKLEGVEIAAEQDAWMPEMAVKKMTDILTANPEINIAWGANEGGTTGAVMAIKNAGKGDRVKVFGTDVSDQLITFLLSEENILQAITCQQPFEIGSLAVQSCVKAVKGQTVEKKVALPGILLSRENQENVKEYKKNLDDLVSRIAK